MGYPTAEEFAYQRKAIRDAYPLLFEAVEEQLRAVDRYLPTAPPKKATKYGLALNAHLARATKTTMGILVLCEHGFGELAMAALRTLAETMVSAYYMSLDPEARAEKFEAFGKHEAVENHRLFEKLGWGEAVAELAPTFADPAFIEEVKAQFPNPVHGWMQEPMHKVAAAIEISWDRPEDLRQLLTMLHLLGDRHSHVGMFETAALLRADEDGVALHLGPGRRWVEETLVFTAWVYGQVFDLWAEYFEVPDLESWRDLWRLLNARIRPLDPKSARGVGRNDPCPCGSGFKFKRCHYDLVK